MSVSAPKRRQRNCRRLAWLVVVGELGYMAFRLTRTVWSQRSEGPIHLLWPPSRISCERVGDYFRSGDSGALLDNGD
jgi:hypothetical protein